MLHHPVMKSAVGSLLPGLISTLLLLLLCICCMSTGSAQTHMVFAHFHMPYAPHGASVAGYMRDIQDAKAVGIDGFALNMGAWDEKSNYKINTDLMFQAAKAMGPGFKLFFSPDMSGGLTAAQIQDMVRSYAKHPNYFYYQGRLVLSSWAGEGGGVQSRDFWLKEVFAPLKAEGINPFFVPMFYTADYDEHPDYAKVNENFTGPITQSRLPTPYAAWWKEVVDGMYSFGCVGLPSYQQPSFLESEEAFARVVHDNKRLFMSAVTPQYWGALQLDNKRRYYEYDGGEGIAAQWKSIIEKQHPEWIELFTWTDFTEASYFSPTSEATQYNYSPRTGYGDDFFHSHKGFTKLLQYYIQWYKSGQQPAITDDKLFYFYRTQPKDIVATHDRQGPVAARYGKVEDVLYITTMLKAPATLRVSTGGVIKAIPLKQGIVHTRVPFHVGEQIFALRRYNQQLLSVTGDPIHGTAALYNFIYTSGFASDAPLPDLTITGLSWSPAQPAPGEAVTFTATVRNQGSVATPVSKGIKVGFWVDDHQVTERNYTTAAIPPGTSVSIASTVPWTASKGSHTLAGQVDASNEIAELDAFNNIASNTMLVGPAISVSYAAVEGSLDLSSAADWAHWGLSRDRLFNKKAGGHISDVTSLQNATLTSSNNFAVSCRWRAGTPTIAASGITACVSASGLQHGFTFTAPADSTQHVLRVYVGGERSEGTFTARLSDGAATFREPMYVSNLKGPYFTVYTVNYRATAPEQQLIIEWKMTGGDGRVFLQAATWR